MAFTHILSRSIALRRGEHRGSAGFHGQRAVDKHKREHKQEETWFAVGQDGLRAAGTKGRPLYTRSEQRRAVRHNDEDRGKQRVDKHEEVVGQSLPKSLQCAGQRGR